MPEELENLESEYKANRNEENLILYVSKLLKYQESAKAQEVLEEYNDFSNIEILIFYLRSLRYNKKYEESKEIIKDYLNSEHSHENDHKLYFELSQIEYSKTVAINKKAKEQKRALNAEEQELKKQLSDKCKEYLHKSIDIKPNIYAYSLLANMAFFESNIEEAKKYYQIIINDFGKEEFDKVNYAKVQLSKILVQQGHYEEAINIINNCLARRNPLFGQLHITKAYAYEGLKDYNKAEKHILKGLKSIKNPKFEFYSYANILFHLKKYDEALNYLDQLTSLSKNEPLYFRKIQLLARIYEETGNVQKAIENYHLMLTGNQKDQAIANLKLGTIYRRNNEFAKSLSHLEKVTNGKKEDKAMAYAEISKVYRILGDDEKELFYIDKSIEQNFGQTGKIEKACFFRRKGKYDEAANILLDIVKFDTKDKNYALVELAKTYYYSGNPKKAFYYCNQIPKNDNKYYMRAVLEKIKITMSLKDRTGLDELLEEAKNCIYPIDKSYYNLIKGNLAFENEDYELALDYYDLVNSAETTPEKLARTAYIYAAGYNDYEKAEELLQELEKYDNNSSGLAKNTHLKILMNSEKLDDAFEYYKKLINEGESRIFKNNIVDLSTKYDEKGLIDSAVQVYTLALSKQVDSDIVYKLANLYFRYRKYEEAEKWLNYIIDNNMPNKNYAILKKARLFILQKRFEEAHHALKLLENTDLDNHAKMEKAMICMENKDQDGAIKIYESMLETDNKYFALYQLAKLYRGNKEYDKSLYYVEKLEKSNSKNDRILGMLEKARLFYNMNKNDKANQIYEKLLIELQKNEKCRKYVELDDVEIKDQEFEYYTEEEQSLIYGVLLEKARTEKKLGNIPEAKKYLSMIKTGCEKFFATCDLFDIYLEDNNLEEAKRLAESINTPNYHDRYNILMSKIERQKGNIPLSREYLRKVTNKEFEYEIKYLEGVLLSLEGKEEEAIQHFEEVVPNSGMYQVLSVRKLAYYYLEKLDLQKARLYFEMLEKAGHTEATMNLINIDIRERKYEDALRKNEVLYKEEPYKRAAIQIFNIISKELNLILAKSKYGVYSYKRAQTNDYNENDAIKYIIDNNNSIDNYRIFAEDVDIPLLFEMIKEKIVPENLSKIGLFDEYILPMQNIGINGENYIKVVVTPNTTDIITMYPVTEEELVKQIKK